MTTHLPTARSEIRLSFAPLALERCFLAADVLHDEFGESHMEYALLGLSTRANPFHVVATPLLPGQRVTGSTVVQPGRQVLRMRTEIEVLSRRLRWELLPIAFIHRHPAQCDASRTDDEFLRGVFIDQVSTVASFDEPPGEAAEPPCGCGGAGVPRRGAAERGGSAAPRRECGTAFSLIVNRERDHRLYAVRKRVCPFCGRSAVARVAARLAADPRRALPALARADLRRQLAAEIRAKVRFDPEPAESECTA